MRTTILSLTATAALLAGASLIPAQAMTLGTAPGVQAALDETAMVQDVVTVCRHRRWSSVRRCWWQPTRHRHWRHRR